MRRYDVLVIGLGIVGSAALRSLAGAGAKAAGIDMFGPTHRYGSSHGDTRVLRRAYWEGEGYLPLLQRADCLWRTLQRERDEPLLAATGGVFVGARDAGIVERGRQTAIAGGIPHEMLDAGQLRSRFPAFEVAAHMEAIYEPGAYMIRAQRARLALLDLAVERGAELHLGDRAVQIIADGPTMTVRTRAGDTYEADAVIAATGPWMAKELVSDALPLIESRRVPIYWFRPRADHESAFTVGRFPVFLHESHDGRILYACPERLGEDACLKIGFHNSQQLVGDPDGADRLVPEHARTTIIDHVRRIFPAIEPTIVRDGVCFHTTTDDASFLVGRSSADPRLVYASACSGHGFKFAPAVGESVALLALGAEPLVDLTPYSAARFATPSGACEPDGPRSG